MSDCIFCRIIQGDLSAEKIYEDRHILAFYDIQPVADVHALVIPKKHIESLNHLEATDRHLITELTFNIPKIAELLGLKNGYKTLINTGKDGGQKVFHLHYHILGGKIHGLKALKNT